MLAVAQRAPSLAAVAVVLGYACAWISHAFIEHNRLAIFRYPLSSIMADWNMWACAVTGRLRRELRSAGISTRDREVSRVESAYVSNGPRALLPHGLRRRLEGVRQGGGVAAKVLAVEAQCDDPDHDGDEEQRRDEDGDPPSPARLEAVHQDSIVAIAHTQERRHSARGFKAVNASGTAGRASLS
ncbi:MAG TPA: DUF962 domain-containing protein, partial [Polyangia bacterium]|nr:DUF962 domain-containing protein [Polyangia bacterium]